MGISSQEPSLVAMRDFDHFLPVGRVSTINNSPRTLKDVAQVTESIEAKIKRLGQMRPESLASSWSEVGFVFSIVIPSLGPKLQDQSDVLTLV
jgi:hypothetical protein